MITIIVPAGVSSLDIETANSKIKQFGHETDIRLLAPNPHIHSGFDIQPTDRVSLAIVASALSVLSIAQFIKSRQGRYQNIQKEIIQLIRNRMHETGIQGFRLGLPIDFDELLLDEPSRMLIDLDFTPLSVQIKLSLNLGNGLYMMDVSCNNRK
jgi:hypothetical protein